MLDYEARDLSLDIPNLTRLCSLNDWDTWTSSLHLQNKPKLCWDEVGARSSKRATPETVSQMFPNSPVNSLSFVRLHPEEIDMYDHERLILTF